MNIGGCFWGHPAHGYFSPYQMETLTDGPEGEYLTQRLGSEAVRLICERDKTKPFFLNFWHYAVHAPMQAPADLVAYFEEKSRKMGLDKLDPFEVGEHFPIEAKKDQRVVRRTIQSDPVYAAMIYSMDQTVGQLVETLRSGRWKYIEFYEDNSRHLFDLETDVAEKKDVAAQHPDLVERFHGMLTGWLRDCDAAFPTPNPDFK